MRAATPAAAALMARYVEQDIAYKRDPDSVTQMTEPEPQRIVDPAPPAELYHIEADPSEADDLAQAQPKRVSRMLADLETWFERVESDRQQVAVENLVDPE